MRTSKKSLVLFLFLFPVVLFLASCQQKKTSTAESGPQTPPADEVNTFVGTIGGGNTFPGATMPFGMIQWSPVTGFSKHVGDYVYTDTTIRGFSVNHLSGPGCPIMGDVPIMPWVGAVKTSPASDVKPYSTSFSHSNEEASPGYYSVDLGNGVKVQLTVTTRAGIGTFTFPSSADANVLFETSHTANRYDVRKATVQISGKQKISGSVATGGFCSYPNKYTIYFAAEFSRPFTRYGTWSGSHVKNGSRSVVGPHAGAFVGFDASKNQAVEMKIGLSYVSVKNAWMNLNKEIPGWDFKGTRKAAHDTWNQELEKIAIKGGTKEEQGVFYTALYHTLLAPNVFSDVNGQYIGFNNHLYTAKGYTQYANYSGWDIYRDEVQLISLFHPKEASDMITSLVKDEQQGGGLPKWPVANYEACQMVGNPSCPIIADAYAFGARDFDAQAALKSMLKGATQPGAKCNECGEWDSLENYLKHGYLTPTDVGQHPGAHSGPSQTLEFTAADFSIARIAKAVGDTKTYDTFMRRAQFWRTFSIPKPVTLPHAMTRVNSFRWTRRRLSIMSRATRRSTVGWSLTT